MKQVSIAFIAAICLCQAALARVSPSFTYTELMNISDLVVLIEHESTKEFEARDSLGGAGRITTAKVLTQLKGEFNEEKITIHHFFYANTPNAPNHVTFPPEIASTCSLQMTTPAFRGTRFINPTRQYLAFLKKQEDGSYIPVTPQYDSNLSFVPIGGELNRLWMSPNDSGITERGEQPLEIRTFVEAKSANIKEEEQAGSGQPSTRSESDSEGGDKSQPWSEAVNGLRARLSIEREKDSPFLKIFLEIQNTSDVSGNKALRFTPDSITPTVTNKIDKELQRATGPYSALIPTWTPLMLPCEGTMRFRINYPGLGYDPKKDKAIIDMGPLQTWRIPENGEWYLSGSLKIEKQEGDHPYMDWSGTLSLPKVRIPQESEEGEHDGGGQPATRPESK